MVKHPPPKGGGPLGTAIGSPGSSANDPVAVWGPMVRECPQRVGEARTSQSTESQQDEGSNMDTSETLKEILKSPGLAAFSRIRYVGTLMTEEKQGHFLKALFKVAVEARESGSIDALADLLEEWEAKGLALAGARARAPQVEGIPWASLRVSLRQAKLAIVTTGGFYVEGQKPYETDGPEGLGDWSFRAIPKSVSRDQLRLAHLHYDLSGPRQDPNCVLPLDRFQELEREGVIGRLADANYSFMGYIQRPEQLMSETAPEVARLLKADDVDAVFLTST